MAADVEMDSLAPWNKLLSESQPKQPAVWRRHTESDREYKKHVYQRPLLEITFRSRDHKCCSASTLPYFDFVGWFDWSNVLVTCTGSDDSRWQCLTKRDVQKSARPLPWLQATFYWKSIVCLSILKAVKLCCAATAAVEKWREIDLEVALKLTKQIRLNCAKHDYLSNGPMSMYDIIMDDIILCHFSRGWTL